MKKNILNKILIVCGLLAMVSCKAKKLIVAAQPVAPLTRPVDQTAAKLNAIREKQVSFNTFSAKARAGINIDGSSNDCTLNIRVDNNKKIWVSVTALLGIEIARAEITPDSLLLINRLQGVYLKKPFSYLYAYANKQVDYAMLQALLVGNAIPSLLNEGTAYHATNDTVTLNGALQDLVYKMVLTTGSKVIRTNLSNQNRGQSLQISNSAFVQSGAQQVPSQIDIVSIAENKKIQVNLRYVKTDFNLQQDYPFNIPDGYTPAE